MVKNCMYCNKKYNDKPKFIKHIIFCELNNCRLIPFNEQKKILLDEKEKIKTYYKLSIQEIKFELENLGYDDNKFKKDYSKTIKEKKTIELLEINTKLELLWDNFAKKYNEIYHNLSKII